MRGNYKKPFLRGQNLTVVDGKAPVYQVYPVCRITGEGRSEFDRAWALGLNKRERGGKGGKGGGAGPLNLCAETINPLRGLLRCRRCNEDH